MPLPVWQLGSALRDLSLGFDHAVRLDAFSHLLREGAAAVRTQQAGCQPDPLPSPLLIPGENDSAAELLAFSGRSAVNSNEMVGTKDHSGGAREGAGRPPGPGVAQTLSAARLITPGQKFEFAEYASSMLTKQSTRSSTS